MTGPWWWETSVRNVKSGQYVEYLGTGRVKYAGVGDIFQSGGLGSSSIWVGDVDWQLQGGSWEYPPPLLRSDAGGGFG